MSIYFYKQEYDYKKTTIQTQALSLNYFCKSAALNLLWRYILNLE